MKIISIDTMRLLERNGIDAGVSEYQMMYAAGCGAARIISDELTRTRNCRTYNYSVSVIAGRGNNGGDGSIVAAELAKRQIPVRLFMLKGERPLKYPAAEALELARNSEVEIIEFSTPEELVFADNEIIVDALIGIGFAGELSSTMALYCNKLQNSKAPIIALDCPSGLNCDTGEAQKNQLQSQMTITFGLPKNGLLFGSGAASAGVLRVVELPIPDKITAQMPSMGEAFCTADARRVYRAFAPDEHKNSRGRVAVIAGSSSYKGAPFLSAEGALRSGAGLVQLLVPASSKGSFDYPKALIVNSTSQPDSPTFNYDDVPQIQTLCSNSGAALWGPGVTLTPETVELTKFIWQQSIPLVVDADGLNAMAVIQNLPKREQPVILTPHPGEAARLLQALGATYSYSNTSRLEVAQTLARHFQAVVVLKGLRTIVAAPDGRWSVNTSGNVNLATAGSGDVLAGCLAALLSGGRYEAFTAAQLGVFIHGRAGELSPYSCGTLGDELPKLLALAFNEISGGSF